MIGTRNTRALVLAMLALSACGGGTTTPETTETTGTEVAETPPPAERHREPALPSGAPLSTSSRTATVSSRPAGKGCSGASR